MSADFRLTNVKIYEKNYNLKHRAKNLIKKSLYSIPELSKKEIQNYRIISNPGCYPTSIQIPLIPLINCNKFSKLESSSYLAIALPLWNNKTYGTYSILVFFVNVLLHVVVCKLWFQKVWVIPCHLLCFNIKVVLWVSFIIGQLQN